MSNLKPHPLLDAVKAHLGLNTDAALCGPLDLYADRISKIRNGCIKVGSGLMIRIHEQTGMPISLIKELAAA